MATAASNAKDRTSGAAPNRVPRIVLVTRATDYESLLARHGTREQARFFLATRGEALEEVDVRHQRFAAAVQAVSQALPVRWRRSRIDRGDLSRFVFEPDDVIVAVGQDGLVANVAKYLSGQPVIGINPDRERYDGILVPHPPAAAGDLISAVVRARYRSQDRAMVEARLDDGQRILALNEVFVGHTTHQSARYRVRWRDREERHSSSGLIVSTGTGATGWAHSIHRQRHLESPLPAPTEPRLAFFVREPFPSVATCADLQDGVLEEQDALDLVSEMNDGGTIFGDGMEEDRVAFAWGMHVQLGLARERLRLVVG